MKSASGWSICEEMLKLIKYVNRQIDSGRYDTVLINEDDSQTPAVANDPDGYWVYILIQT